MRLSLAAMPAFGEFHFDFCLYLHQLIRGPLQHAHQWVLFSYKIYWYSLENLAIISLGHRMASSLGGVSCSTHSLRWLLFYSKLKLRTLIYTADITRPFIRDFIAIIGDHPIKSHKISNSLKLTALTLGICAS